MHFLLFSQGNFENFLKCFPNNCVFRPNGRKINAGFVNFLKKQLKLCIYCNFYLRIFFCKFSKIFRRPGGLRPPDPLPGRPPKMFPPEPKSWRRRWSYPDSRQPKQLDKVYRKFLLKQIFIKKSSPMREENNQ